MMTQLYYYIIQITYVVLLQKLSFVFVFFFAQVNSYQSWQSYIVQVNTFQAAF